MNAYDIRMMYQMERSPHALKYETIRNCIFAADIEPSAVDIAQLRLWLSLVIDDEINPDAQTPLDGHRNPLPLPNLESNILCGNSLVDEFEGIPLIQESELLGNRSGNIYQKDFNSDRFDSIIRKLIETQDELFRCDNTEKKKELKEQIVALRDMIIMNQLEGSKSDTIQRYNETKQMASKPYILWQLDFARVFKEKGGFDIVIGNPPYVLIQDMENVPESLKQYYRNHFSVASYKVDLYHLFIERGSLLLHNKGVYSYIVPSNFTTNNHCSSLRCFLLERHHVNTIIYYDENVFRANVNNLVFVATVSNEKDKDSCINMMKAKRNGSEWVYYDCAKIDQEVYMKDEYIIVPISGMDGARIVEKIGKNSKVLKSYASVNFGMQLRDRKTFSADVTKDSSLFTVDHKPCYTGKDIGKYIVKHQGLYCYFNREAKRGGCWEEAAQLANPKLLCKQIGTYPVFGIDTNGYPVLNTAFMISQFKEDISPYALLGILNSKIIRFYWIQRFSDNRKQFPKIKGAYLEQLPIKRNCELEKKIVELVLKILRLSDAKMDISTLENQIDQIVYQLYGLTTDDISVIEKYLDDYRA